MSAQERERRMFATDMKFKYDLTPEDWARMYNSQDGKCAACQKQLLFDNKTCVDHDHKTGKFRGLFCHKCNRAVGYLEEPEHQLRVKYLERTS